VGGITAGDTSRDVHLNAAGPPRYILIMRSPLLPIISSALAGLLAVSLSASAALAEPTWGACPPPPEGLPDGGLQCATIDVPLDYRNPGGRQIQVAIPASPPPRRRSAAGCCCSTLEAPAESGLDLPRLFALLLPAEVRDRYDLIGFDPRFIGQSTPLSCGLDLLQTVKAFPPMMQPGGFDQTVSFTRKVAETCQASAGDRLPFATTANTARGHRPHPAGAGRGQDLLSRLLVRHLPGAYTDAVPAGDRPVHPRQLGGTAGVAACSSAASARAARSAFPTSPASPSPTRTPSTSARPSSRCARCSSS
jgi:hypothetical protein